MKKTILFAIALMMGMAVQAQGIRVNYKGAKPTISDFVTAYLSQEDDEEMIRGIREDWGCHQQGKALSDGASFLDDEDIGARGQRRKRDRKYEVRTTKDEARTVGGVRKRRTMHGGGRHGAVGGWLALVCAERPRLGGLLRTPSILRDSAEENHTE